MVSRIIGLTRLAVWLVCLLTLTPVVAAESVGKVIVSTGEAYARTEGGERRALRRRSEFFVGETLGTGGDGQLQLRFRDGALVALRENSQLRIDEYHFEAGDGSDGRSVSTLIKGGFRTITGLIGKQDPEAYRVDTPVATIGIRGTHYEAVMGSELAVAAWQGAIVLENEGGRMDLGMGAAYNFASVKDLRQPPAGLLAPPAVLQGREPPPMAGEQPDQRETGEGGEETGGETQGVNSDDDGGEMPADGTVADASSGGEDTMPLADSTDSGADTLVGGTLTETLVEPNFVPDPLPASIPDQFLADARLSDLEKQRLASDNRIGIMILSGPGPKNFPNEFGALTGGVATASDLGPVITTSAVDPGTNDFSAFVSGGIKQVYRPGTVSSLPPPAPVPASPGYGVEWGAWDAVPTNPLAVQTDAGDPSVVTLIDRPVFWATLSPADKAVLDARTGTAVFSNVVAAFGHASNNGVGSAIVTSDFTFTASIDFNTGIISAGQITVGATPSTLPEEWTVNFTGKLNGPLLDIDPQNTSGTVIGSFGSHAVEADIGALLTGSGANAAGGGFAFTSKQDGNIHAEGLFLVTE